MPDEATTAELRSLVEITGLRGPFKIFSPSTKLRQLPPEAAAEFVDSICKPKINTVHFGDMGTGKSLLIGALQDVSRQTSHPNHEAKPVTIVNHFHKTRNGSNFDTNGLNDPTLSNQDQTQRNLARFQEQGFQDLHVMALHVQGSVRSNAVLQSSIDATLVLSDNQLRNVVVIVKKIDEASNFNGIIDAVETVAEHNGLTMPETVPIINLFMGRHSAKPESAKRQRTIDDINELGPTYVDYWDERAQLSLLFHAVARINEFDKHPIALVKRNEECIRCGQKGDSRLFKARCHGPLKLSHPKGAIVRAHEHSGSLGEPEHWNAYYNQRGKFKAGLHNLVEACVEPHMDKMSPSFPTDTNQMLASGSIATAMAAMKKKALIAKATVAYTAAEATSHLVGIGRWDCCTGKTNSYYGYVSDGCAQQWSCCGQWQFKDGPRVSCTNRICKHCKLSEGLPPRLGANEMSCTECGKDVGTGRVSDSLGCKNGPDAIHCVVLG